MRIVRLANFVTPRSGGLRTALNALGEGYLAAGHEPVLVVPSDQTSDIYTPAGRVISLRGLRLPHTGGYRIMLGRRRLTRLLDDLEPDRIEVSDRLTLRWTGAWARERGVPALMVSHESLTGLLATAGLRGTVGRWLADRLNARTARQYQTVLCTTAWAAEEFDRLGTPNLVRAPLGVDLDQFHPDRRDWRLRARYVTEGQQLIVHCGRLSAEKRPERSVAALAELCSMGVDAVLVVAGHGPMRTRIAKRASGLPVVLLDHVADRPALAALLASADVAIAPGPIETFGLAALEALACGTPVVVDAASALPEVVGPAGVAARGDGTDGGDAAAFARGVRDLLDRPEPFRRAMARQRAELFSWPAAVAGFLDAHGARPALIGATR